MRTILGYFKNHFKEDFSIWQHLYFALFVAACIYLNYYFDWGDIPPGRSFKTFENVILDSHLGTLKGMLFYTLFYAFAYFAIVLPFAQIKKSQIVFRKAEFWIKSLSILAVIGAFAGFYFYPYVVNLFSDREERYFVYTTLMYVNRIIPFIIVLVVLKKLFDKNEEGLYGLKLKNVKIGPYLFLLALVLPLILWASFQSDFLSAYPKFRSLKAGDAFGLWKPVQAFLCEFSYGLDFVATELIFRGALVIGMTSLLKKEAILPMVAVYAFFHFGKPMGEAISSVFGGYILGVIALYSRNIWGGIVIHLGVAYLMEIAAFGQGFFR